MINESLQQHDLRNFLSNVITIDSYKSKIGDDQDVIVVCFTVDSEDPAKDLENFIEMGYNFVLDADVTSGETDDGTYKVFVEIERDRHAPKHIRELLDGVEKISKIDNFRFRYFKSFKSKEATEENLATSVPLDSDSYKIATEKFAMENFSNFFSNSYADNLTVLGESISFKRIWKDTVTFDIITSGPRSEVYESIKGPIMIEGNSMAEVMFLTKYIGNYNITKISNAFIFENNGWAVALKRK